MLPNNVTKTVTNKRRRRLLRTRDPKKHTLKKRAKFCLIVYCVPVSVTSQLNVVMLPVFAAAVNVNVAWIDASAFRTVFCRFHVNVSEEPAPLGVQLVVVIVSVSGTLPVFLTYTVWVALAPGLR